VRQTIGLDTLSVSVDDDKGATLSAGKYISDRVYIGVDQGVSTKGSAVRAEIDVTEKIELETVTGTGESSLGVNWKHDY
jgi:translocation and assembly module TamB